VKACSENVEISVAVNTMLRCAFVKSCCHPVVAWLTNQMSRAVVMHKPGVSLLQRFMWTRCFIVRYQMARSKRRGPEANGTIQTHCNSPITSPDPSWAHGA